MSDQSETEPILTIEADLTWVEANKLRVLVDDYTRDLLAKYLLAQEEGRDTTLSENRYGEADRLNKKVYAMFRRMSEYP